MATASGRAIIADQPESLRRAWYLAYVLALLFALSYTDRQIVGVLIEPMKHDLRMNDTQLSLVGGTSFVVFYVSFGFLMGRAADVFNRKWIVIAGVIVWTMATALCGLANNVWELLILRMGVGLGEAALVPCTYSMLGDAFPRHKLTTAISLTAAAGAAGMGFSYFAGASILGWANSVAGLDGTVRIPLLGDLAPWRIVFLSVGLPGILLAALLVPVREPRRKGEEDAAGGKSTKSRGVPLARLFGYLKDNKRLFIFFYLAMGCISITGYTASFWDISFFHRTYGWPPTESGRIYGMITITTAIVGAIAGGRLADYLTNRWSSSANVITLVGIAALNIPFRLLYPLMPTPELAILVASIALFVLAMPWGIAAAALQIMVPSRMRGQFTSIFMGINAGLGLTVGPTAVAMLTDYVFADSGMLRYSLLIVGASAQTLAALLFWQSARSYQQTLDKALTADAGTAVTSSVSQRPL